MYLVAIYDNYDFSKQIEYTFKLIFSVYGIAYKIIALRHFKKDYLDLNTTLVLSYGTEKPDIGAKYQIHIYASDFFAKDYLRPSSMPKTPLIRVKGEKLKLRGAELFEEEIPVIYWGKEKNIFCDSRLSSPDSKGTIHCPIDIIASIFFMVTRYEEVVLKQRDEHGRFPATASLAYKENFLNRPIVNEYIEILWNLIDSFSLGYTKRKPWVDRDFAVCLTHDVDLIRRYHLFCPPVLSIATAITRERNIRRAVYILRDYGRTILKLQNDPCDTFDWMMDLERKYGFKSSFYFLTDGTPLSLGGYSIRSNRVRKLIKSIEEKGVEVGLHGSLNSNKGPGRLKLEKKKLDRIAKSNTVGGRQHFLKFEVPKTWRSVERAGLKYDSSLGFADREGFRCGICFPYKPFDVIENREMNIWELPLVVMDAALQYYQGISPEEALEKIKALIDTTKKYSGVFVLLWHNTLFSEPDYPGWSGVYARILEYLAKQEVFSATAEDIISTWQADKIENKVR